MIVEQPTYDRTLLLLNQAGAELAPVPLESDGVDIGAVEAACEAGPVKLAHVIPNFHNPAGCTLAMEKRERLVALAAEHGFLLFEDDPYRLICLEEPAGTTMLDMDEADRVIHASSFSKTVSPGVRVGYLVGPATEIGALAKTAGQNYISPNMLAESIVWELCRSGALEENVKAVNAALRERRDALVAALRGEDSRGEVRRPRGRLLPLAGPRGRRGRGRAAGRGQEGGRDLRRRARLHDRRGRVEHPPLVRAGARRAGSRGRGEDR